MAAVFIDCFGSFFSSFSTFSSFCEGRFFSLGSGGKSDGMQAGDVFLFPGLFPPLSPFFSSLLLFSFPFLLFFSLLTYGKLLFRLKVKLGSRYILLGQLDNCNVRIGYV